MSATLGTTWENIDGRDDHYRCATELYLISMFSRAFYVITDRGISAPEHDREVVYGLNTISKSFLFQLMSTEQLCGAKRYETQTVMRTGTHTPDFILTR